MTTGTKRRLSDLERATNVNCDTPCVGCLLVARAAQVLHTGNPDPMAHCTNKPTRLTPILKSLPTSE